MEYVKHIESKSGKTSFCFYIGKRFQGLGFVISFDNPTVTITEFVIVEFRFLFLKTWLRIDLPEGSIFCKHRYKYNCINTPYSDGYSITHSECVKCGKKRRKIIKTP